MSICFQCIGQAQCTHGEPGNPEASVTACNCFVQRPESPLEICTRLDLFARDASSEEVKTAIRDTIAENPSLVEEYHAGRKVIFNALMGIAMKKTMNRVFPDQLGKTLTTALQETPNDT
jgi:Asp-tRNA(Asn)/Glu-tRNA(Gln) amidotransferase B subunit